MTPNADGRRADRNRRLALIAGGVSLGMLALSFAAVPFYRAFCAATGLTGTTQVATTAPVAQGRRVFRVRFDTNVARGLPVTFLPESGPIEVRTGQTATVFFKATNTSERPLTLKASYNVAPYVMGLYFAKIACFCFNEQTLQPRQTLEMPVVFFLDPALEKDETISGIDEVMLSYTYSPVAAPGRPVAADATKAGAKL